jgi:plasmid stabilization system protein ParE
MRLTLFAGNMAYRVELTDRAVRDLAVLYEDKHVEESKAAARWFNGLEQAVDTLGDLPRRCTAAPESKEAGRKLRHLLYGKRPHVYRVIFEIDEPHKVVNVLTIRHGAMETATPEELR